MRDIKELLQAYRDGDLIEDNELTVLITHHTLLEQLLSHHGERMHIAWRPVNEALITLQGYKAARKSK